MWNMTLRVETEMTFPTGAASQAVDETKRRVNLAVQACQWRKLVLRR